MRAHTEGGECVVHCNPGFVFVFVFGSNVTPSVWAEVSRAGRVGAVSASSCLFRSAAVRRRRRRRCCCCFRRRCRRRCSVAYVTRRWQVVCVPSSASFLRRSFHHRFSASFRRDFCVKKIKTKQIIVLIYFLPVCVKRKTVCVINEANDVNDADPDDDRGRLGYLLMLITNDLCNSPQNSHDFSAKNKQQQRATTFALLVFFLSLSFVFLFSF